MKDHMDYIGEALEKDLDPMSKALLASIKLTSGTGKSISEPIIEAYIDLVTSKLRWQGKVGLLHSNLIIDAAIDLINLAKAVEGMEHLERKKPKFIIPPDFNAEAIKTIESRVSQDDMDEIEKLLRFDGKVSAIKRFRTISTLGLKSAKDFVELNFPRLMD